nr:hypothetical protein [Veillonella denticariosi]
MNKKYLLKIIGIGGIVAALFFGAYEYRDVFVSFLERGMAVATGGQEIKPLLASEGGVIFVRLLPKTTVLPEPSCGNRIVMSLMGWLNIVSAVIHPQQVL